MQCPNCKEEITRVRVYSEAWQWGELDGKVIADYGVVEELTETTFVACPVCHFDLTELVEL